LPTDQAIAEEEHGYARALAFVDVAGKVAVTVADESRRAGSPCVVQTVVEGARHVPEYAYDHLQVLHRELFMNPTENAKSSRVCTR